MYDAEWTKDGLDRITYTPEGGFLRCEKFGF